MSLKRHAIPALQALVVVTSGCQPSVDPGVGSWEGDQISLNGNSYGIPFEDYFANNGLTLDFDLRLEADGTGSLYERRIFRFADGGEQDRGQTHAITTANADFGVWSLSIPTFAELSLACSAGEDSLRCTGLDAEQSVWTMDFERAEP